MSSSSSSGSRVLAAALLFGPLALSACPDASEQVGEPELPLCEDGFRESLSYLQLDIARRVDILFVIDNSSSMDEEPVRLNAAAQALFAELDAAELDYRIGFTTTDNGNPWCPAGSTTPEAGKLVLSSCTDRVGEFGFGGGDDVYAPACSSQCTLSTTDLEITPTTTALDDQQKPRPWIERRGGVTNLPAGIDPLTAFKCFAPQGINGCGFESPLESLYLALARAENREEENYGFLQPDAVLAVVLLTDEADCSYIKAYASIFEQDGNRAFWSDPQANFPTSAVCWNAGVECSGNPISYDGCEPADKRIDGSLAASESDAVLHPLSRYLGKLEGLEQQQQEFVHDREIVLSVIAGVEGGGPDWSVRYADAIDPVFQNDFGIGPGCTDAGGQSAVPPVRMRALAEAFDPQGLWSICAPDYTPALASLGQRIASQFEPICMLQCIADADLSTPRLEPDCRIRLDPPGSDNEVQVLECLRGSDGAYLLDADTGDYLIPEGEPLCYAALIDPDGTQTLDPADDMAEACASYGSNLEYTFERRSGYAVPEGASVTAVCEYSDCTDRDCPGIGLVMTP